MKNAASVLLAEKFSELPHERERQLNQAHPTATLKVTFTELKRFCGLVVWEVDLNEVIV